MPKHCVLVVSSGVISNSWVFRTPHSHVTLWWWNASGRTVIFTLVNTSITFFTMIALSNEGCDALAAVRRFFPSWRDGTFLAKSFLRNWSRTEHVRRAVPLSLEVLLGSAAFTPSSVCGTWWARCMLAFQCLLRTGEILTLKAGQITFSVDSGVALLALPASKGAKLKNVGKSIVVSDPTARALLAFLCRGCSPQDRVLRLSFKGLASALYLSHTLSPSSARIHKVTESRRHV